MFHFMLPSFFYWLLGYRATYQIDVFDIDAMKLGFLLNFFTMSLAIIAISFTPLKSIKNPTWKPKNSLIFLVLSLFFTIGSFVTNDYNYYQSLMTLYTRRDYWVLGEMFFNLDFYIIFAITYSFNFVSESSLVYIFIKTMAASRSAPLSLLHYGMCAIASPNFTHYRKKYSVFVCIALLFGVFGFNWATNIRDASRSTVVDPNYIKPLSTTSGSSSEGITIGTQVNEAAVVNHAAIYKIMARISYLESVMLPIHYKNVNDKQRMTLFNEKYSPIKQLKLIINNLVPGDIFEFDVYPNQYYRAAFFIDFSTKRAKEFYTSINMTLPVYFYMYFSFWISCIAAAALIWLYFILTAVLFRVHPLLGVSLLATLYPGLLTFFDFVMIVKAIVVMCISAILYMGLARIDLSKFFGSWGRVEK